ncbi:L,D-transpeptidase [Salmonella enterica subsp. enterica serovar Weltevreden]|nr:L,D-transpeptidase [Salmonella enterica subsp. enterica serovar Weltevreden]
MPAVPITQWGITRFVLAAYGGVYLLWHECRFWHWYAHVSSGCIRLRDGDIETLFRQVTPGTK